VNRRSEASGGGVHAALASPARRRLLDILRAGDTPRDAPDLAGQVGLHLTTVRFHLEVLHRAGLLTRAPAARTTVGRPRTGYTPVPAEAPDPNTAHAYQDLSGLLAGHLSDTPRRRAARAERAGLDWARQLLPVPRDPGCTVEEAAGEVNRLFTDLGFDPDLTTTGDSHQIALRACPFRAVAREHPEVVCSVHLGLLRGSLTRLGVSTTSRLLPFIEPDLCLAHLT